MEILKLRFMMFTVKALLMLLNERGISTKASQEVGNVLLSDLLERADES